MGPHMTDITPVMQFVFRKIEKAQAGDDEEYKRKLLETGCVTITETETGWTATSNTAPWIKGDTNDQ